MITKPLSLLQFAAVILLVHTLTGVSTMKQADALGQVDASNSHDAASWDRPFVFGGQFKDLILPMPIIDGLESEGIWGGDNVVPRDKDNGIEDNQWCYWGGNPVLDNDGKYHMAICRWPESKGHHGWLKSEVAHCVADNPLGPYKVTQTIVKEGHNPEVLKLDDGSFALHVMNRNSVYTAPSMAGPWTRSGTMRLDTRDFRDRKDFGSNLTSEFRPDGSIIIMKKDGDITISDRGLLGPYKLVSIQNYGRATGYAEDPVIWRSLHQYHCVYNHAQDRRSAYMRSLDGINWKNEYGVPYDASTTYYTDGTKNKWYKFERPKVVQDELGRATHLALAIMDVSKGADKGNDNHSSKNMIVPLVTEKIVAIQGEQLIDSTTKSMDLKIQSEPGFDAKTDLDIASLRFGSDSVVNHGGGCIAKDSRNAGDDLIVTFEGHHGLTHHDYDFKLIGKTKDGDLAIGYALLPGKSPLAASLIATPFKLQTSGRKNNLTANIENVGLSPSKAQSVYLYQHAETGGSRTLAKTIEIPPIPPYGTHKISVDVEKNGDHNVDYRFVIAGTPSEYWQMVDHTDPAVEFSGRWEANNSAHPRCFFDSEMVSKNFGDRVTFQFEGTRARAYGRIGRKFGAYKVFVDGKFLETVRCNYGHVAHEKIFQTPLLPHGVHTLTLEKVKADFVGEVTIDSFAFESHKNLTNENRQRTPPRGGNQADTPPTSTAQTGFRELFDVEMSNWDSFIGVPHTSVDLEGYEKSDDVHVGTPLGLNNDPKGVFTMEMVDGQPQLKVSGLIYGGFTSKEEFENYHLSIEFKWGDQKYAPRKNLQRDSGLLYHCVGDHGAFWFVWMRSVEFQIQERDFGDLYALAGALAKIPAVPIVPESGPLHHVQFTPGEKLMKVGAGTSVFQGKRSTNEENDHGQWNVLDLYVYGDQAIHVVNGRPVNYIQEISQIVDGKTVPLKKGKIQLQSEGAECYYRAAKIRSIEQLPPDLVKQLSGEKHP